MRNWIEMVMSLSLLSLGWCASTCRLPARCACRKPSWLASWPEEEAGRPWREICLAKSPGGNSPYLCPPSSSCERGFPWKYLCETQTHLPQHQSMKDVIGLVGRQARVQMMPCPLSQSFCGSIKSEIFLKIEYHYRWWCACVAGYTRDDGVEIRPLKHCDSPEKAENSAYIFVEILLICWWIITTDGATHLRYGGEKSITQGRIQEVYRLNFRQPLYQCVEHADMPLPLRKRLLIPYIAAQLLPPFYTFFWSGINDWFSAELLTILPKLMITYRRVLLDAAPLWWNMRVAAPP